MNIDNIINNLCLLQGFTASAGKPETSKLVSAAISALCRTRNLLDDIVDNYRTRLRACITRRATFFARSSSDLH